MKIIRILILLLLCSTNIYSQDAHLKEAREYLEIQDYKRAIKSYSRVLKNDANNLEALFNRAYSYERTNQSEKALFDYNNFIRLSPNYSLAYYNRGNLFFHQKEYELAIRDYNRSTELDSNHYHSFLMLGISYQTLGKEDSALICYNYTLFKKPDYQIGYLNRGILYRNTGKLDLAFKDLKKSISLSPNDYCAIDELMLVFAAQNNYKFQEKFIKDSLPNKKSNSVITQYSYALLMQEKYKEAISLCTNAIIDGIECSSIYNNRGFCYLKTDEFSKAIHDLKKANKIQKNDPIVLNNLGFAIYKKGNLKKGLALINKSIKIDNTLSYSYRNRAIIYLEMNDVESACNDLVKAKELSFGGIYGDEVKNLIKKYCNNSSN